MKASKKQIGGNHYKDAAIQPYEFCHRNGLGYLESNVIKYVFRHKFKNGREDIEKAIHTLNVILEYDYPEDTKEQLRSEGYRHWDDLPSDVEPKCSPSQVLSGQGNVYGVQ